MIGNLRSYYDSVTGHIFERVPLYVHSVDHTRSPQKIVAIDIHMQQELPHPFFELFAVSFVWKHYCTHSIISSLPYAYYYPNSNTFVHVHDANCLLLFPILIQKV